MKPSIRAYDLIKKYESCRLTAYLCPAGIPTIGYGHTNNVKLEDRITLGAAYILLQEDVQVTSNQLNKHLNIVLSQNQYDALVCLVYNIGIGNFLKSRIFKNLPDTKLEYWLSWTKANGKELRGLVNRRNEEFALFTHK